VTDFTTVKVTPVITITPANPSVPNGERVQLSANESLPDGTTQDITTSASWTSSDPRVAFVVNKSFENGLVIGEAVGSATIKATGKDGVSGSTTVTVGPAALISISITPADSTLCFSETLKVIGFFSDGTQQDLQNNTIDWVVASSDLFGSVTVGCGANAPTILGPCPSSSLGTNPGNLTVSPPRPLPQPPILCVVTSCTPSEPLGANAGVVTLTAGSPAVGQSATINATLNTNNGPLSNTATVTVCNLIQ
jgi:hypothetical protein